MFKHKASRPFHLLRRLTVHRLMLWFRGILKSSLSLTLWNARPHRTIHPSRSYCPCFGALRKSTQLCKWKARRDQMTTINRQLVRSMIQFGYPRSSHSNALICMQVVLSFSCLTADSLSTFSRVFLLIWQGISCAHQRSKARCLRERGKCLGLELKGSSEIHGWRLKASSDLVLHRIRYQALSLLSFSQD